MARAHARRLHSFGLRRRGGITLDAAPLRWQSHRGSFRFPRHLTPFSRSDPALGQDTARISERGDVMSAPLRFLAVTVAGWVLFRGLTAGLLPVLGASTVKKAEAAPVSVSAPTDFAPISEPVAPAPDYAYGPYYQ